MILFALVKCAALIPHILQLPQWCYIKYNLISATPQFVSKIPPEYMTVRHIMHAVDL